MEKGFLSLEEKVLLRKELSLERYAKYSDRIKCILLLDSGKSIESIIEYLFLSRGSVSNYYQRYLSGGIEELVSDDYHGSECRLTKPQQLELSQHIDENLYQTTASIRDYIESKYSVHYSLSGIGHLLRRFGFVYKKPKAIPGKADKIAQEEFLQTIASKLDKIPTNEAIYYADAVHPQHNTACSYGWIKKGKNKEIKTNTGRQRVNINGVVNAHDPTDVVIEESISINAQSTIAMFKKLENKNPELSVIYVIADNARYYRNNLVKDFLKTSKIQLLFLPPYSPNLNLIERLWRLLKKTVLYNKYYEKFTDFRNAILNFFTQIKTYTTQLQSLMTLNFHTIGA